MDGSHTHRPLCTRSVCLSLATVWSAAAFARGYNNIIMCNVHLTLQQMNAMSTNSLGQEKLGSSQNPSSSFMKSVLCSPT